MVLMVACSLLLLAGVLAVVRWGGTEVELPEAEGWSDHPSAALFARRFLWYLTLAVASGVGAGVLVAGAGGRLAMRLLAATAGDAAQGRRTEAEEIVGRISAGGTIGFVVFVALFFGFSSGVIYMLIRRWLPRGRPGGLVYGALLLAIAATRFDPLRADNPDFDIVGPGWLSVAVFAGLVLLHGMLVAALAGRYSTVLPLLSRDRRALAAHAPLAMLAPIGGVLPVLALMGVVAFALSRLRGLRPFLRSQRASAIGRSCSPLPAWRRFPAALPRSSTLPGAGHELTEPRQHGRFAWLVSEAATPSIFSAAPVPLSGACPRKPLSCKVRCVVDMSTPQPPWASRRVRPVAAARSTSGR